MNGNSLKLLEFDKVIGQLAEYAVSDQGKAQIRRLVPSTDIKIIENWIDETTEARMIIDMGSGIPIHSLSGVGHSMNKLEKAAALSCEELSVILGFLQEAGRLKKFMQRRESVAPRISTYALSINPLEDLEQEINRCINCDRLDDSASPELARIRKRIAVAEERIKSRLHDILKSPVYASCIQDAVVSIRGGRYVIPIKKEYRKNFEGQILDMSSSGSTIFIEPEGIRKLQSEVDILRIEEDREEYRILLYLTGKVESRKHEILINIETMVHYDFMFAKARYSREIGGNGVEVNEDGYISISNARHPMLEGTAVPLNFTIGDSYRALVITGPNTGGKTVALKTVGLLTMMVQAGLHVPADRESCFAVFKDVLVDIGDGQSIEQSLSTFSSHIKNIIEIINSSDRRTLAIIDELGAGTDPGEGMGLAVAILEEVFRRGGIIVATTHYSEIKEFAGKTEGFENGCMEFDLATLKPLYRLRIGTAGESNAFNIALRLGMNRSIIERAHQITYRETKKYENFTEEPAVSVETKDSTVSSADALDRTSCRKSLREIRKEAAKDFKIGDCVYISSLGRTGIVCEPENARGEVVVMVMKKKLKVNKKRLSIYVDSKDLYPENYDFDTIFEAKEDRKKRKIMKKRHVEGITIEFKDTDM